MLSSSHTQSEIADVQNWQAIKSLKCHSDDVIYSQEDEKGLANVELERAWAQD